MHGPQSQNAFAMHLQQILTHIQKEYLSFEQLYLILYESNIKFTSTETESHIKQIFRQNNNLLPLRQCFSHFEMKSCVIVHNRPTYYVDVKSSRHDVADCFEDWKAFMLGKFGNQLRWFQAIVGSNQIRKVKSFAFKNRIRAMLKGNPHEYCADAICQKFPKNCKNEIDWPTFMAIIRYKERKSVSNSRHNPTFKPLKQQSEVNPHKQMQFSVSIPVYRPKLSYQRNLKSQKMRGHRKNSQTAPRTIPHNSSLHLNQTLQPTQSPQSQQLQFQYCTNQNIGGDAQSFIDRDRYSNSFWMKSSVEISKELEQVSQKFKSAPGTRKYRTKSAKLGGNIKDYSFKEFSTNTIKSKAVHITSQTESQPQTRPSWARQSPEPSSNKNVSKYITKINACRLTHPSFFDDTF